MSMLKQTFSVITAATSVPIFVHCAVILGDVLMCLSCTVLAHAPFESPRL